MASTPDDPSNSDFVANTSRRQKEPLYWRAHDWWKKATTRPTTTTPVEETDQRSSSGEEGRQPPATLQRAVTKLDKRERIYSYAAAAVAAAIYLAIYIPHLHDHVAKGRPAPAAEIAVGLVMAGILAAATLVGRRALVGFAALLVGMSLTGYFILALPFLGLAGWLLARAYRVSKELAQTRAAERTRAAARQSTTGERIRRRRDQEPDGRRQPPQASKRYTPPKQPSSRKRPPTASARRDTKSSDG